MILLIVLSCNEDKGKNIPSVSISDIKTSVVDYRPYALSIDSLEAGFKKYPVLSEIFFGHILGLDLENPENLKNGFEKYLEIEATENIARLIDSIYEDLKPIEEDWAKSMAYFHHYFPSHQIPSLYIMQTNLGLANFLFEDGQGQDAVGVSLDFFLGSAFPYIQLAPENAAFSNYNNRTFNADHVISKSVNAIVDDMVGAPLETNLINSMIREGKRLYILESICAEVHDSAVFELSDKDLIWCENNELEMWNFFVEQELIYETDLNVYGKYLRPAPNSPGMPADAPGKTAAFIGYKIVESYMNRNTGLSMTDLAQMPNLKLYEASRYKPKRQ